MIGDLDEKIKGVDSAIQALNFKETDKIYLNLSEKYGKEYVFNNIYFFFGFGFSNYIYTL